MSTTPTNSIIERKDQMDRAAALERISQIAASANLHEKVLVDEVDLRYLLDMARHPPSLSPPTDEAQLREKYRIAFDALCRINLAKNQASAEIAGAALQKCIDVPEAEESAQRGEGKP